MHPLDEAKNKLMVYNIGLLALTNDEQLAIADELTSGMSHSDVARVIERVTGREATIVTRGSKTRIRVAYHEDKI